MRWDTKILYPFAPAPALLYYFRPGCGPRVNKCAHCRSRQCQGVQEVGANGQGGSSASGRLPASQPASALTLWQSRLFVSPILSYLRTRFMMLPFLKSRRSVHAAAANNLLHFSLLHGRPETPPLTYHWFRLLLAYNDGYL